MNTKLYAKFLCILSLDFVVKKFVRCGIILSETSNYIYSFNALHCQQNLKDFNFGWQAWEVFFSEVVFCLDKALSFVWDNPFQPKSGMCEFMLLV